MRLLDGSALLCRTRVDCLGAPAGVLRGEGAGTACPCGPSCLNGEWRVAIRAQLLPAKLEPRERFGGRPAVAARRLLIAACRRGGVVVHGGRVEEDDVLQAVRHQPAQRLRLREQHQPSEHTDEAHVAKGKEAGVERGACVDDEGRGDAADASGQGAHAQACVAHHGGEELCGVQKHERKGGGRADLRREGKQEARQPGGERADDEAHAAD
mmetsp:Transcript_24252/g.61010  ORF Transcript_24252/g.61010 Transcript_24252/m.61010 type:complete len:211 (+) Transcript_24252:458-1090(+)